MAVDQTRLDLTEPAQQTLLSMQVRCQEIAGAYGETSEEHVKALKSLLHALLNLFRLGGTVYKDGDLSLITVSFITYGTIFHRKYINGTERDPLLGDWSTHS